MSLFDSDADDQDRYEGAVLLCGLAADMRHIRLVLDQVFKVK